MDPVREAVLAETRRQFFGKVAKGIGGLALSSLLAEDAFAIPGLPQAAGSVAAGGGPGAGGLPSLPHFAPQAKRCIYLHMMGAPPQMDLLDYKPAMKDWYDKDLPESIRQGQRLTTMTSGQARFPIAPSVFKFSQHGQSGAWISELLPLTASMADDICIIRSMNTDAINHEPAITFIQTGREVAGQPCIGSWISYGLGSLNGDLPTFVVMNAERSHPKAGQQAISAKLWSSGFLSPEYAGVGLRGGGDPVLYVNNPEGVTPTVRRRMLDGLAELNQMQHERIGDPETLARIEQYEMAFRMQTSVPEMSDLSSEPESTWKRWGEEARQPGKFQNAALMARRLVERGVRFVQIYHRGWDVHGDAPIVLPAQAREARSRGLGADPRSQGAWPVRRDARHLGRRVRPHHLLAGPADAHRLRPRPPPALLHPVDGGRRRQGGRGPRRDGRVLVQHREGPGARPGPPGDDPAPVRHRPRAVHVPAPGARRAADGGGAGPRGAGSRGLSGAGVAVPACNGGAAGDGDAWGGVRREVAGMARSAAGPTAARRVTSVDREGARVHAGDGRTRTGPIRKASPGGV